MHKPISRVLKPKSLIPTLKKSICFTEKLEFKIHHTGKSNNHGNRYTTMPKYSNIRPQKVE